MRWTPRTTGTVSGSCSASATSRCSSPASSPADRSAAAWTWTTTSRWAGAPTVRSRRRPTTARSACSPPCSPSSRTSSSRSWTRSTRSARAPWPRRATRCGSTSSGIAPAAAARIGCSSSSASSRSRSASPRTDMTAEALSRLETLLRGIYDLDPDCRIREFLVTDRQALPDACRSAPGDEQLYVATAGDELCLSLYLDPELVERLESADPSEELNEQNVADCWTALEGISHFLCVVHPAGHDRSVSRLTLELQAEIDKYVASFL